MSPPTAHNQAQNESGLWSALRSQANARRRWRVSKKSTLQRFDLASKFLNDHAMSRKLGRGEDVGKAKAEKEVRVMRNPGKKKALNVGCEGIEAEVNER